MNGKGPQYQQMNTVVFVAHSWNLKLIDTIHFSNEKIFSDQIIWMHSKCLSETEETNTYFINFNMTMNSLSACRLNWLWIVWWKITIWQLWDFFLNRRYVFHIQVQWMVVFKRCTHSLNKSLFNIYYGNVSNIRFDLE